MLPSQQFLGGANLLLCYRYFVTFVSFPDVQLVLSGHPPNHTSSNHTPFYPPSSNLTPSTFTLSTFTSSNFTPSNFTLSNFTSSNHPMQCS